jgi:asparagine synthase (glutamine-hydrolysing)
MCGIAGFYGTRDIPDAAVDACLGLMKQRGPDASGVRRIASWTGRRGVLLHTRLSIIDLDPRANQPFHIGKKWLTYNGEVYNYIEVREELEQRGAGFATASDTEVLLAALDRDGMDALKRCEGMWSFALFDEADGSLTLCRDRFGEKPLYIHRAPEGLYFGSEVKFLFALMGRSLPVNRRHLMRYLVNGYKALYGSGECFFEQLDECAPGTWIRIDSGGSETETRYWTPAFAPDDHICRERAVREVRDRLIEAVRMRLRSDVPLAFLMSGGVDSNALISIAKRVLKYDVHGFTIMSDDPRYDEGEIVRDAVQTLGVRHTPVHVTTKDFLPRMRELVSYHDAPVFTITYYVQWLLMEHVKQAGYKISISGTAADELFSGYYDHYLMYLAEMRGSDAYAPALAAWQQHIQPEVRNPHLSNPDLFRDDPEFRDHIFLNNDDFAQYLVPSFCEEFHEHAYTSRSLLRNRMMNEMFHEAVPVILHEDDLNAMYFSIENRSPFLDRELFELCYRIPTPHLMRDGFNKSILRDAVRGIAPDSVVNQRRKTGFNAPVESFLDLSDTAVKRELLADGPVFELIKRDKIAGLLEKRNLPNSESKFLFYFVNTKLFLERFAN